MKVPTMPQGSPTVEPLTPAPRRGSVRLFDGRQQVATKWDGLRRDTTLWFDDGDCLVHLYILGASQRGPSLRLRYADVEALRSNYLLDQCLHVRDTSSPLCSDDGVSDSGYASSHTSLIEMKPYELYIPTPAHLARDQAYSFHLTTRNFFAYATSKPIVGEKLGIALTDLLERMRLWQPRSAALANFTSYCEAQGYMDMAKSADHAIACLVLAESAKLQDLWAESFVHCVGMHAQLESSREFDSLSNTTKALITRASLEMDLHIARVTRALGSFLEEELGSEHLGLSKPARDHLDRFRSCLHNYYVDKLGYYPPDEEGPWNKRLWTKMYHAFQTLYEYLVDSESSTDPTNSRGLTGGICVVQNVQAFDQRHGYAPLPHPLPLLPSLPSSKKRTLDAQKGLRSFRLGRPDTGAERRMSSRQALTEASNSQDAEVMACELVQEYQSFERQKLDEKLSVAEARKVRWLLIYGVLQMLISITRAPKEVRDTETPAYPLCVLTVGCPFSNDLETASGRKSANVSYSTQEPLSPPTLDDADERLSIHPDCEAENAEDYFSAHGLSRQGSQLSLTMAPAPLRMTTQLSRTASIRSSVHSGVHALHRSFVGSLARRNSLRQPTYSQPLSKSNSFCEILVEGYGNGLDCEAERPRARCVLDPQAAQQAIERMDPLFGFDFGLENVNEEPVLQDFQLNGSWGGPSDPCAVANDLGRSASASSLSTMVSDHTASTGSFTHLGEYDSPTTEFSFWSADGSKRNSENRLSGMTIDTPTDSRVATPSKRHNYQRQNLNSYGVKTSCYSVNAGCYTPTGASPIKMPMSKFSQQRAGSAGSAKSSASSHYPDRDTQADEIEEEEMRGRRRSRALDRLSQFDISC